MEIKDYHTSFFLKILILSIGWYLLAILNTFGQQATVSSGGINLYSVNEAVPVIQSIGQASVIGNFNSNNYLLSQGFLHPVAEGIANGKKVLELQASIYPNPFNDKVIITLIDKISAPVNIEICDLLGKVVYSGKFEPVQKVELDLSDYNTGFYFIKINTGNRQLTTKLIKGS